MKKVELVHFVEWRKVADEKFEETLADVASWGVKNLVAHPCWGMKDEETPGAWEKIVSSLRKYNFASSACQAYWGPGKDISPADPEKLKELIPYHLRFLDKLGQIGVRTYTLHISMGEGEKSRWNIIGKALEELLPAARKNNIILALENGDEVSKYHRELIDFINSFNDPFLGVCFDTGHANCYGDREWKRSVEILGEQIVTCHLHDNYGSFDDHNPPGEGNIDWNEMCAALKSLPRICHAETESGNWSRESWERFAAVWN